MDMTRVELLPGVWLNALRSVQFNTACLSVNLLTQLSRETASMNALIPFVLRRGCAPYGDTDALAARLDELGGTTVEPLVRRIGEVQCLGLRAEMPEGAGQKDLLRPVCALLGDLLLNPATRGGLLLPRYVDGEREKMLELLRGRAADEGGYAVTRCVEEMCCFEDYAAGELGSADEMKNVRYQKLSKHYRSLLQSSPIEILYCGRAGKKQLAACLLDALATLPRGEIDEEIGTELRMNALEDQPREVTEEAAVEEGRLVVGFRLGDCMDDPDPAALTVFNAVFDGRLRLRLTEEQPLCREAGSGLDAHKGLLLAACSLSFDKKEAVQSEIFAQLEALRRGEIGGEELQSVRSAAAAALRQLEGSPRALEDFSLPQIVSGMDLSPAELAELCEDVSPGDLADVAASLDCDLIYFLTGKAPEEADADA